MKDYQGSLQKLRNDAADCALIRDRATDAAKREIFDRLYRHLTRLADEVEKAIGAAERIKEYVNQIVLQLSFAALPQLRSDAEGTEQRYIEFLKLQRLVQDITDTAQIDAKGREGLVVSRLGMNVMDSGVDRSEDPAFKGARPEQPWFGPVTFRKETEPYMSIAVRAKGEAGAVTVADVNLKFIWDVISRIQVGKAGAAYVVDERGLLIARDGLRPDLQLSLGYGLSDSAGLLKDVTPEGDQWEANAALVLELPLDRQAERNAYRSAQIALDRARRDLQLTFDGVERDVRSQLRSLKQVEQQIQLQTEQIAQEQRAVAVTQIRYESGDADSRDLLEARQSLVDAQNELIDLQARHVIARLTLLRTLGVLVLGDDGMWKA